MVQIIRKGALPAPAEVPEPLRLAAAIAGTIPLREPRPIGFPLLFSADLELIEPAVAFLHEHAVQRAHTRDTLRTYAEILYDWLDTLEQNRIQWSEADAADLIAYRNRMLQLANVSRNSLYRYHSDVLREMREHQGREVSDASARLRQGADAQRAELITLRHQTTKLAALVDHYYAAYREAQALLTRREQELADLRRRLDSKPAMLAG